MKAIEPKLAGARQHESNGFRFHPALAETRTRGRVTMNMEGLCLSWERGRLARKRGPEVRCRRPPPYKAGETPAFPGSILQGFRPEANETST